jgi:preprotein translocase subunit SecE
MSDNTAAKKPGFFGRLSRSFRDMKGEVKKVVWPSRKQIINNTLIVIAFVVIAAIAVGGVDMLLTTLVDLLLNRL